MNRILVGLGLVVASVGFAGCLMQMPTQPNASSQDRSTLPEANSAFHVLANVFTAAGDITPTVTAYRQALGTLNANTPGSQSGGRREINWDAVPPGATNTDNFPADFFNQPAVGRARGAVFSTPGTGFRVSDNNFSDLDAAFGHQFVFFSPIRTFAAVGSSEMTVQFFVPGSSDPAVSTGFGVVFSDVDREGSASIRLFDAQGKSLGRYAAPPAPGGLSFVGVVYPTAVVARVEIESGQAAVAVGAVDVSDRDGGKARDLVIMDDFIYGEPTATAGAGVRVSVVDTWTGAAGQKKAQGTAAGSEGGAAGQIPAIYDGEVFTINVKQMPDPASAALIGRNGGVNVIYATNDLDDEQDFLPVIDAIQGDSFNPLWRQTLIVFNQGFTPHQFESDTQVLAAAAGRNPEITLVATDEMYRCSVVGH